MMMKREGEEMNDVENKDERNEDKDNEVIKKIMLISDVSAVGCDDDGGAGRPDSPP